MKKRIFVLILFLVICLGLTGCNYQPVEFHYSFNKAVCNYNGNDFEIKIDKWTDYEGEQLQITSGNKIYLVSANKCYLVKESE